MLASHEEANGTELIHFKHTSAPATGAKPTKGGGPYFCAGERPNNNARTDLLQPKECFCVIVIYYEKEDAAERENADNGSSESAGLTSRRAAALGLHWRRGRAFVFKN